MLEAIISFLPSEGAGAIGALDWTKEERQRLASDVRSSYMQTFKYLCMLPARNSES